VHRSSAKLAVIEGFQAGLSVVVAAELVMVSVFGDFIFQANNSPFPWFRACLPLASLPS
jgi:hypothetical protein